MTKRQMDLTWSAVDGSMRGDAIYYVWVKQEGEVAGCAAMAWTSPIWITTNMNGNE